MMVPSHAFLRLSARGVARRTKAPQKEPVSDDLATAVEDPSPNCARNSEAAQSVPAALPPLEWLAAQPSNLRPCPRHDHAAIVLDGYMYVFGGLSRGRYRNGESTCVVGEECQGAGGPVRPNPSHKPARGESLQSLRRTAAV